MKSLGVNKKLVCGSCYGKYISICLQKFLHYGFTLHHKQAISVMISTVNAKVRKCTVGMHNSKYSHRTWGDKGSTLNKNSYCLIKSPFILFRSLNNYFKQNYVSVFNNELFHYVTNFCNAILNKDVLLYCNYMVICVVESKNIKL